MRAVAVNALAFPMRAESRPLLKIITGEQDVRLPVAAHASLVVLAADCRCCRQ